MGISFYFAGPEGVRCRYSGCEVEWDTGRKEYRFHNDYTDKRDRKVLATKQRAALDANKNVVYLVGGEHATLGSMETLVKWMLLITKMQTIRLRAIHSIYLESNLLICSDN